jgi:2-desacetyl-2-hydroxyethyl bacteriochlorophyllide A dehydrogenase
MRALQIVAPREWKFVDIPKPPAPKPDEALVRVHRMGVCGTDISCFLGKFPFFEFPRIPGHELGVEVIAVGSDVKHLSIGQKCCVEPYLNCGKCYACRRGFTNCCEHNQTFGVMCDGGLTDEVILPARKLHPVGDLSYDQAALVETLAIGCHAVDRAHPKSGEAVLVIGAGPIGLSVIEFAKLSGARVIVADISESRLAFVRDRMGVVNTVRFAGDERDPKAVLEANGGEFADVVIDATGNHHSMARALEFAAFAGRVVYVGITQNKLEFFHAPVFHRRELTLMASRNARSSDFARIVSLIQSGDIDTQPWITHRGRFEEVPERFPEWIDPAAGVIKAIIEV